MNAVFVYGPPGVGKLTVARELSALTGYRLFDNHARFAFVQRLFDFGTDQFWKLEGRLSHLILEAAIDADVSIIATFVAPTSAVMSFLEPHLVAIEAKGGRASFTELYCEQSVNEERLEATGRAELGKLTNTAVLRRMLASTNFRLDHPTHKSLWIDNTLLPADVVARMIAGHYALTELP